MKKLILWFTAAAALTHGADGPVILPEPSAIDIRLCWLAGLALLAVKRKKLRIPL